ncbi:alpha/beta hydrolase fold protein [Hyaloscypha bicolor E]|uniref:Alpha/beta hydrolase fold protein n=1 Tax=Hyaloscypha bicolor E TaxID=1095630 RepID=A0A2J6SSU7_9HELO|nr:alpha/beta hydrolase fold protein [Hyaloscypha bicolor E]PMD53858.1 alpha/beta hydrolase fold protein [Hyaloscypha bicolor E]
MPSVATRAGDVSYSVNGTGSPIFLLHANLHSSQDFASIIPELSLHYQTFAIDFPWHGASTGTSDIQPTAPHLADALEDLVIALDLPPAVFIGNSVGGFSAARLAITHPEKVKGLVLINNGGFIPWSFALKAVARPLSIPWINRLVMPSLVWKYMLPQTDLDKSIAEQVSARAKTIEGSKVAAGIWSSFPSPEHDLRSRSEELKAPTLLVWGKRDPVAPLSAGIATQKCIKGSRLEVLDTGHVVFASRPEEFLELVEPFVKECFKTG